MNNPTAQRHRFFQSLARIAVLLAICLAPYRGIATDSESPAASLPAARFTRIVYSDSGGFTGEGTGKWLSIDGDGKLQLKKRKGGEAKGQLSDQELTDLGRDVAAVDWSTVEKHYRSRRAGMIQNDLVVTIGGKTHGTHAVVGSAEIPPALKNLFSRLSALYRQFTSARK